MQPKTYVQSQHNRIVYQLMEKVIKASDDTLRERVANIRSKTVSNLRNYLKEFKKNAEENGFCVFFAKDVREAREYLNNFMDDAVKSKTNVGRELGLHAFETDTGDVLAALLGQESGHPILPAHGLPIEDMARALSRTLGRSVRPTPRDVVLAVREYVRSKLLRADVGITGANVLTVSGEVFILENEGNIALVSHFPKVHVVVTSVEKLVENYVEAMYICEALARYGTGQRFPTYINVISGPSATADVGGELVRPAQGPAEVHIVLLDNGRLKLLESRYRDILKCINCGACLTFCPVFHVLCSEYGFEHKGTRGVLLQRYQKEMRTLFEKAFFCIGCAACREVCPAKIDLPTLIRMLREELHRSGLQTEKNLQVIKNIVTGGDTVGAEVGATLEFYCC